MRSRRICIQARNGLLPEPCLSIDLDRNIMIINDFFYAVEICDFLKPIESNS